MNPKDARRLAEDLMQTHLGPNHQWRFRFDTAKRRLGSCQYTERTITLSRPLTLVNSEDQMRDTILHEIAHVIAGHSAGHGPRWKAACVRVGARPDRCASMDEVVMPTAPWYHVCPQCDHRTPRYKRPSRRYGCATCRTKTGRPVELRLERGGREPQPVPAPKPVPPIPARKPATPAVRPPAGPLTQGTLFGT